MPPTTDQGAHDHVDRLDKLKDRIRREFPGHVRTHVTGLGVAVLARSLFL
jgi:hypothetical protein